MFSVIITTCWYYVRRIHQKFMLNLLLKASFQFKTNTQFKRQDQIWGSMLNFITIYHKVLVTIHPEPKCLKSCCHQDFKCNLAETLRVSAAEFLRRSVQNILANSECKHTHKSNLSRSARTWAAIHAPNDTHTHKDSTERGWWETPVAV